LLPLGHHAGIGAKERPRSCDEDHRRAALSERVGLIVADRSRLLDIAFGPNLSGY
jgi:hypothetical protein